MFILCINKIITLQSECVVFMEIAWMALFDLLNSKIDEINLKAKYIKTKTLVENVGHLKYNCFQIGFYKKMTLFFFY